MHTQSQIVKNRKVIMVLFVLFGLISFTFRSGEIAAAQGGYGGYDPTVQTPALLYDEARTVYLGNLARRDNGVARSYILLLFHRWRTLWCMRWPTYNQ